MSNHAIVHFTFHLYCIYNILYLLYIYFYINKKTQALTQKYSFLTIPSSSINRSTVAKHYYSTSTQIKIKPFKDLLFFSLQLELKRIWTNFQPSVKQPNQSQLLPRNQQQEPSQSSHRSHPLQRRLTKLLLSLATSKQWINQTSSNTSNRTRLRPLKTWIFFNLANLIQSDKKFSINNDDHFIFEVGMNYVK